MLNSIIRAPFLLLLVFVGMFNLGRSSIRLAASRSLQTRHSCTPYTIRSIFTSGSKLGFSSGGPTGVKKPHPPIYVEAEIVRDPNDSKSNSSSRASSGDVDGKSNKEGGLWGGLMKMIGQDEESKARKAQKAELTKDVDAAFQGTGLLGSIAKALIKGIGGKLIDQMAQTAADNAALTESIADALELDRGASSHLGEGVVVGPPLQMSSQSSTVNGATGRRVTMMVPARGSKGSGMCEVHAGTSGGGSALAIITLVLRTDSGQVIRIGSTPTPSSGGGVGGGKGNWSGRGRGEVIDVEAEDRQGSGR